MNSGGELGDTGRGCGTCRGATAPAREPDSAPAEPGAEIATEQALTGAVPPVPEPPTGGEAVAFGLGP